jgi:hypothetical protein
MPPMTDDEPVQPAPSRGWLVPVAVAFAVGFLVLTGIFYALDHLPQSKPQTSADAANPTEILSVKGILKSVAPMLRERCATSAKAALTKNGIDPAQGGIGTKIESYCTCAVDRSADELSIRDLLAFKLNPSSEPAASKMKTIMQKCQEAMR